MTSIHIILYILLIVKLRTGDMDDINVNILQWNARSLNKNIDYLVNFLADSVERFHVLLIQSPFCQKDKLPEIEGYFYPPECSCNVEGKAFTCTYVHKTVIYEQAHSPLQDCPSLLYSNNIQITVNDHTTNFLNIYYVYGYQQIPYTDWLVNLDKKQYWFIAGDFNSHNPVWENGGSSYERGGKQLLEHINSSDLVLLNDGSMTRYPDKSNSRLAAMDLTLCNPELMYNYNWCVHTDPLGSDHCPVITQLDVEVE